MDAVSAPGVERVVLMTSAQIGKALAIDTPLPTPSGWTTMGDVKPGDFLFDENGFACRVTAVSPIQYGRDCYRVTFGDGSEIIADAEHRWYVEPRIGRCGHAAGVKTTVELLGDLHTELKSGRVRNNWAVPVADPLVLPEADLLVPPYVFGLWLGDCHTYSGSLTVGDEDIEAITEELKREGIEPSAKRDKTCWRVVMDPRESDGSYCRGYATAAEYSRANYRHKRYGEPINPIMDRRETMFSRLSKLGVIGRKFIPAAYMRASFAQRLALFQGLMDSDGYAAINGICEFTSTDRALAGGVFELAASLGLKPRIKETVATLYGKAISPKYRITFVAYAETPVFRLKRKQERLRSVQDPRCRPTETCRRFIANIEKVESVPVKCVAIDSPSHLYLAGRAMIPTHNTELLNNVVGFHISQDPAPILVLQPTLEMAETWSKDRLAPMLRDTPALKDKVADPRARDSGNTITHKRFNGGHLTVVGANSPSSLASRPIRLVLADEVDRYPPSAGTEGDPLSLAIKRTATFWNRRIVVCSTPTVRGISRIEAEFEKSDQRRYFVPCPHCGEEQTLVWANVKWPEGRPHDAAYHCGECGAGWTDAERRAAIRKGEWKATAPESRIVGFHLNELYSPWSSVANVAMNFLEAKRSPETLKTWINTTLGETWEEDAEKVDGHALMSRLEDWGDKVPLNVLAITAGVDIQDDRVEVEVVGFGVEERSWSLDFRVIYGDPSSPALWDELDEYLSRRWTRVDGVELPIHATCVDSGGHHTQAVYRFVRDKIRRRIFAVKGMAGPGRPVWPKRASKNNRGRINLFLVGVDAAKDAIYARLKIAQPGPGYCHFPKGRDVAYFEQLTAEKVVTKYVKGFPTRVYMLPGGKRNEALDCRVYAYAALQSLNLNWGRVQAEQARAHREPAPADVDLVPDPMTPPPPPPPVYRAAQRGRVRRSSWM